MCGINKDLRELVEKHGSWTYDSQSLRSNGDGTCTVTATFEDGHQEDIRLADADIRGEP